LDSSGTWKLSARSLVLKTFYLSPEFKTLKVRERPGDIFSLGMAFYKMMFGIFPFTGKDDKEIIENVKKALRRTGSVIDAKVPFPIVISKQT
jgi:serine/threonine protein kinase